MTYKVLNNITLKNVSDGVLSNLLTELLVIPVNKKILASPEFKELDKTPSLTFFRVILFRILYVILISPF